MSKPKFTVGDLRRHLAAWPDDMELIFSIRSGNRVLTRSTQTVYNA